MKKQLYTLLLPAVLLLAGCQGETPPAPVEAPVEVELSGAIGTASKASIDAPDGLPPRQLSIGIAMLTFPVVAPIPASTDWLTRVAWRRGYFGANNTTGLGALPPITKGEIKFTNDEGTSIQRVFYDDTGLYYFLRAVYPWDNAVVTQTVDGGVILFHEIDGSQDIMCSNLGWGNMTDDPIDPLVFSHLLTKLNVKLVAENEAAVAQYGTIKKVELVYQPNEIILDIAEGTVFSASSLTDSYVPVGFPAVPRELKTAAELFPASTENYGYVMALPGGRSYTFRIETENRLWFYAEVKFPALAFPGGAEAGTAYNVTLRFKEASQLEIFPEEADVWYMNSTFD